MQGARDKVKRDPSATAARTELGRALLAAGQPRSASYWLLDACTLRPRAVRRRVVALIHREFLLTKFRQGETLDYEQTWRLRRSEDEVRLWQDGRAPAKVDASAWDSLARAFRPGGLTSWSARCS